MVNYTKTGLALLLSLTVAQSWGMEVSALKPSHLKALCLMHENGSFSVQQNGLRKAIASHDVSKNIRSVSSDKLAKFVGKAGYLSLHQFDNGEFAVRDHVRGLGGGALGMTAGAWFGKAIVSVVCHGSIAIVSTAIGLVATPAAGVAFGIAAESTLGASIEAASLAGAIGFGILGGVATGPA